MMDDKFKYDVHSFKIIFFALAFLSINFSVAQDIYRTQNGDVLVTAVSSDSIFTLSSKEVVILLNNSKATFKMTIDKSTFKSDNSSVNKELALMKFDEIVISGKLNVENISNHNHAPLDFDVEGIISTSNKTLLGRGRLEHISPEGDISCLLTLKFIITKEDLGLNLKDLDLSDEVQIDVVQVLLNN